MYSVVVGVGNPLLGDDAIGLEVAERLKGEVNAEVKKAIAGGLELAEMIAEYELAVIIDAFNGDGVKEIDVDEYEESVANHDIRFPSAYHILSRYIKMPKVRIVGIGVKNVEIKEELSKETRKLIPAAIEKVKKILEEENGFIGKS
ncbi:MAG: hydrogenase maturation protease [Thermoplasmata archaeon]|nr:MAG: hydrogenase maturation protease [Thermoplasmata archaeon]KAA0014947.1 MAG: hydrogenase maturation protease [Thermoplasmata archaeon]